MAGLPAEMLSEENIHFVITNAHSDLSATLLKHISPNSSQDNVHPHPIVSLKNSLSKLSTDRLFNPFVYSLPVVVSMLHGMRYATLQLFLSDTVRIGDSSTIFLLGRPGAGKSTILDCIYEYFGGYMWNRKESNF